MPGDFILSAKCHAQTCARTSHDEHVMVMKFFIDTHRIRLATTLSKFIFARANPASHRNMSDKILSHQHETMFRAYEARDRAITLEHRGVYLHARFCDKRPASATMNGT